MNIITAALRKKESWKVKLELFRQYGKNPMLCQSFDRIGPTHNNKAILDARLQELRWKQGLPRYVDSSAKATAYLHQEILAVPELPPEADRLYPKAVEKAIQVRAKAINAREKAGRQLTQFADDLTQEERAALFKTQKDQHVIVAAQTRIINHHKQTGKVLKKDELTEHEKLTREWNNIRKNLTNIKRRAADDSDPDKQKKAQDRLRSILERYEELRVLLGKQKRTRRKTA